MSDLLYLSLDDATERVTLLSKQCGGLTVDTPEDKEWLRNELEQVCELRVCGLCVGTAYTEKDFTVITQLGRHVKTRFNFCPVCGRDLRHRD